ncbi:MAG: MurR/RpiR family transcriptional regulator [Deltaproteobacteria bacterium]|nr:MurR/RpiR family transcriptional regulator [Deltaproteobacteria bacterium]
MSTSAPLFRDSPEGILIRLRGFFPSLNTALKKVGAAVLSQPEMAVYSSVNEVAAYAGVSEASVMRFCRTLGFKGFQDFKIALAREMAASSPGRLEETKKGGSPAALVREVFQGYVTALQDTLRVLDLEAMSRAAQALIRAHRVWLVGIESSGPIAAYATSRFLRLGLPVSWFSDAHLVKIVAPFLSTGDVVVIISRSGRTPELLEIARVARQADAQVVCITQNSLSPLAREGDLVLVTASLNMGADQEVAASRLLELAVIDALFLMTAAARSEQSRENPA